MTRSPNGLLVAVACATGAAVMMLELMAVRLMAPWFGQSQLVWTNVIGIVLAALALGQWLGGRWAESRKGPRPVVLLMLAGSMALVLPTLVAWLGGELLPADLSLLEAFPFVTMGSLLVAGVALGLPMVALGAVTPWLVRLSRDASQVPARVTGRLLGAGTLGSLLGTFGATHFLLGWMGSAATVRTAGGLLIVAGLVLFVVERRGLLSGVVGLLLPLVVLVLPAGTPAGDGRLLAEIETPYQWARVVELEDGSRLLRLNEGLDSFHSIWHPGQLWTGTYFDAFLYPSLTGPRATDGRRDVLVIGLAGGTMARQLLELDATARVRGVEIDSAIVDLGHEWFGLPPEVDVASGVDGRVALACGQDRYGAILIDAYSQQIYLPPHLCTVEFFRAVYERLRPHGVAALNIGGRSVEDPVFDAVAGTFATVFPGAVAARIPGTRNLFVMGYRGAAPEVGDVERELAGAGVLDELRWLVERRGFTPIEAPLTRLLEDGNAPVELLAHESWAGLEVMQPEFPMPVVRSAVDALQLARTWMGETRWSRADRAIDMLTELGEEANAELLRGNLAWERDAFARARGHYQRAIALADQAGQGPVATTARDNLALVLPLEQRQAMIGEKELELRRLVWGAAGVVLAAVLLGVYFSRLPGADG